MKTSEIREEHDYYNYWRILTLIALIIQIAILFVLYGWNIEDVSLLIDTIIKKYWWVYILIINLITFVLFGVDKHKAINSEFRIPVSRLLFFSFIGGEIGAMAGMRVFRHKTHTRTFRLGEPLILLMHCVLIGLYLLQKNIL